VLTVTCDSAAGTTQFVNVDSIMYLCGDDYAQTWVSSGDSCTECATICEMAPSPILPPAVEDRMPLAGALRLGIRTVARIGRSLLLLADHDAGTGRARYQWRVSAGVLTEVDRDLVVWTLPDAPGEQFVQVAVEAADRAAVATCSLAQAA
jgi:hypothetical protein